MHSTGFFAPRPSRSTAGKAAKRLGEENDSGDDNMDEDTEG